MYKKQIVILIGIILLIGTVSIFVFNYYVTVRDFELNNTPEQLKIIFDRCACQERVKANPETDFLCLGTLVDWQNSTHYIDNNICEWQKLENKN